MSRDLARAQHLLQLGRFDEASKLLGRHLAQSPDDAEALCLMALATLELDQIDEAVRFIRTAVIASPDDAFTRCVECRVHLRRGMLDEAEASAREAIRIDPNDADGHAALGMVMLRRKRWQAALDAANEGLRIEPEDDASGSVRAMALNHLGAPEAAKRTLEGQLARDPDDAHTHASLGWTHLHARDYDQAEQHFRDALRLDPNLEWAREGVVEALRARHWFYRPVLRFFLWLQGLDSRMQVGLMFGGWVLYRLAANHMEGDSITAWLMTGAVVLYLVFVVLTWFAEPIVDALLSLSPLGRFALKPKERLQALTIVGMLIVGGASVAIGLQSDDPSVLTPFGLVILLTTLPLKLTFGVRERKARTGMAMYTAGVALVGTVALILMVQTYAPRAELRPFFDEADALREEGVALEARREELGLGDAGSPDGNGADLVDFASRRDSWRRRMADLEERAVAEGVLERVEELRDLDSRVSTLFLVLGIASFFVSQFVAAALVKRARST